MTFQLSNLLINFEPCEPRDVPLGFLCDLCDITDIVGPISAHSLDLASLVGAWDTARYSSPDSC